MKIVATAFTRATPQADGRSWVTERQTFEDGSVAEFTYLCSAKDDPAVISAQRAFELALLEPAVVDPVLSKLDAAREAYLSGDKATSIAALGVANSLISEKLSSRSDSVVDQPADSLQEMVV